MNQPTTPDAVRPVQTLTYSAQIVLDSIAPNGKRLTTMVCTYPLFSHSHLLTHRALSRSAASSRAIPIERMITPIEDTPAMPMRWGQNQPGMISGDDIADVPAAIAAWLEARDNAVASARKLAALGVHKEKVNRLLAPFAWITTVFSATEWENLFETRDRSGSGTQEETQHIVHLMRCALSESVPQFLPMGRPHLPFVFEADRVMAEGLVEDTESSLIKIAVARCAGTSYLNHFTARPYADEARVFDRCRTERHPGPFEHVAWPAERADDRSGNFTGWRQLRQEVQSC